MTHQQILDHLKTDKNQLIVEFLEGTVPDFPARYTQLIDRYFYESYENSKISSEIVMRKQPYAIVALGGYGRSEQCIQSDIDLLFLFDKSVPDEAEELFREIVYPLWDLGMTVGHATRSVDECLSISETDIEIFTSLLDSRFVCGMSHLFHRFHDRFKKEIIQPQSNKFIKWLLETNTIRHHQFGDSSYRLEPNLKEGQGGLRDYHTILWIARIRDDIKYPRDLEFFGYLSYDEYKLLTASLEFLWNVRSHLHYLARRKCDQLHFEYQEKLADILKYQKINGQLPVERFLGDVHSRMDFIKQQYLRFDYELEHSYKRKTKKKKVTRCRIEGLEVRNGMLNFVSPEAILKNPILLIKIFEESARRELPLSIDSKRLVKDFLHLVDSNFRNNAMVIKSFEKVLVTPAPKFNVLNEMLITGFLEKFIPEFKGIINRIQYDEYHIFPVDRHLLRTVRTIKQFGTSDDPAPQSLCGRIYGEITNKTALLWAALLHDIGKSDPGGGHSQKGAAIVERILKEKGYDDATIETVTFLVQEHLLLAKTTARRDINDEETAMQCIQKINTVERLKMLYVLTVADSICTGPKAWKEWTGTQLKRFFMRLLSILENGELGIREYGRLAEKKKEEVLQLVYSKEELPLYEKILSNMPQRYLVSMQAKDIINHIKLYQLLGDKEFVWDVPIDKESQTRTITVCAKDRPGLFSKISGIFTLNGVNILDATIHTWQNRIALDIFVVTPPPDLIFEQERWDRAKTDLENALLGKLNISESLKQKLSFVKTSKPYTVERPHRVIVDNKSSSYYTIIEVVTYDSIGLLYKITDAIFRCGLDISIAKISTKIDQVVDVFYVRDLSGEKADSPEQEKQIQESILSVIKEVRFDR